MTQNETMTREEYLKRKMHTPDDPQRAGVRAALKVLSRALLPLHKALIDAAKAEYAAVSGEEIKPSHLLKLLTEDPAFAWLRPMTGLIVQIDELTAGELPADEVAAIRSSAEGMFEPGEGDFAKRYFELLQSDIDVAMTHPIVRDAIRKLKETSENLPPAPA